MNWGKTYNSIREGIIVACLSTGAALFWGALFAGIIRYFFDLDEEKVLLYIGLPIFMVVEYVLIKKLPDELRKLGWI